MTMPKKFTAILFSFALILSLFSGLYTSSVFAVGVSSVSLDSATFYVDAIGGNDNNNGTEQDKAWKTLAKVNSVTFQPGDQLLFKADGVWNGSLRPQGSGEAGNPIVIGQYGEGEMYP